MEGLKFRVVMGTVIDGIIGHNTGELWCCHGDKIRKYLQIQTYYKIFREKEYEKDVLFASLHSENSWLYFP